jgi:hypothetical protein
MVPVVRTARTGHRRSRSRSPATSSTATTRDRRRPESATRPIGRSAKPVPTRPATLGTHPPPRVHTLGPASAPDVGRSRSMPVPRLHPAELREPQNVVYPPCLNHRGKGRSPCYGQWAFVPLLFASIDDCKRSSPGVSAAVGFLAIDSGRPLHECLCPIVARASNLEVSREAPWSTDDPLSADARLPSYVLDERCSKRPVRPRRVRKVTSTTFRASQKHAELRRERPSWSIFAICSDGQLSP